MVADMIPKKGRLLSSPMSCAEGNDALLMVLITCSALYFPYGLLWTRSREVGCRHYARCRRKSRRS